MTFHYRMPTGTQTSLSPKFKVQSSHSNFLPSRLCHLRNRHIPSCSNQRVQRPSRIPFSGLLPTSNLSGSHLHPTSKIQFESIFSEFSPLLSQPFPHHHLLPWWHWCSVQVSRVRSWPAPEARGQAVRWQPPAPMRPPAMELSTKASERPVPPRPWTTVTALASSRFLPRANLSLPHDSVHTVLPLGILCLSLQLFHRNPHLIFRPSTKMSPLQKASVMTSSVGSHHPKPEPYSSSLGLVSFTEFVILQLADSSSISIIRK